MKVPMLDTRRQNLPLEEELTAAYRRVLHSGQFILGPEVERFERVAAEIAGTEFAIGVSSGTDAIHAWEPNRSLPIRSRNRLTSIQRASAGQSRRERRPSSRSTSSACRRI